MIEIDKHKIYQSHDYQFKNFIMMNDDEKRMVLKWRNDDSVRKWMYSAKQATEEEHFNFIKTLESRNDRWYWLVYREDLPVGVLVLSRKDGDKEMFEHGIYMNPELGGEGFGLFKEIDYMLFYVLDIPQLCGSIQSVNNDAIYLNRFLGMNFIEKKIIPQDGIDVEYLICHHYTKEDFEPHKDASLLDYVRFIKNLKKEKGKK